MTVNQAIKDLEDVRGWNDKEYLKRLNVIKTGFAKLKAQNAKLKKDNQALK